MSVKLPPFDQLLEMAQNHPEKLEELRQHMIEDAISAAQENNQRRLRGLQFQIDAHRRIARHPMSACMSISRMMHDQLYELRCLLKPHNRDDAWPEKHSAHESNGHAENDTGNNVLSFSAYLARNA